MRPRTPPPATGSTEGASSWLVSVLVGAASFAVYLWLAPTVSGDRDSSEFTLVLALDGIAHPTGYPIYTVLGHWFVVAAHALGAGWAFAANAWSALGGAVAMALMHRLGTRLVPASAPLTAIERSLLPLVPVALMLLNPAWTQVTTVAEVYSWHQVWAMGLALCLVSWLAGPDSADVARDLGFGRAMRWGFLCGMGAAHHGTWILVAIPLTIALGVVARPGLKRGLAWLAAAAVAGLVPLSSYLLMRLKMLHPGPAQWTALENSWAGLWAHISAAQYGGAFGRFAPEPMDRQLIHDRLFPFLFPGLVLLVAAWNFTPRGHARSALAGLLAAALVQAGFAFLYGVEDPSAYFLPALAFALLGIVPAAAALAAMGRTGSAIARTAAVVLAALAIVLSAPWVRASLEMRANLTGLDRLLHDTWASIAVERGIVLWPHDMSPRLRQYQLLDGEKPALDVVNPWTFTSPVSRRRFAERYGFDPMAGVQVSREALLASGASTPAAKEFLFGVADRINANTELPVIVFAPEVGSAGVMPKGPRRDAQR